MSAPPDSLREGLYTWDGHASEGRWEPLEGERAESFRAAWGDALHDPVIVAESFRVSQGRTRGADLHRERFLATAGPLIDAGPRAWASTGHAMPREGEWFPRIEIRRHSPTSGPLLLHVRPAPPAQTEAVVATAPHDPRTDPLTKGPDLDALGQLRAEVAPLGAGEAIILSREGFIVEGAWSSLVWWRPDGTLVHPSAGLARIPSVTAALLLRWAASAGVTIEARDARPDDLDGCELWVLSALHGLRVATSWVGGPRLAVEPGRAVRGRAWLDEALEPLPRMW
jgi:branched-subunit amino acid aminotransferase/4-amino-4-deoxychorismate lyase